MMKTSCIHPGIVQALSHCGHGDKILIADGNYPLASKTGDAEKIYLGLTAGVPKVTEVLEVICGMINVEKAEVMSPDDGEPPIFAEFRKILNGMELGGLERYRFYETCCENGVRLVISTGEKRTFANILLTVGVA